MYDISYILYRYTYSSYTYITYILSFYSLCKCIHQYEWTENIEFKAFVIHKIYEDQLLSIHCYQEITSSIIQPYNDVCDFLFR